MEINQNPELYEKMKKPYKDAQECNEKVKGFFKELCEIREKYKVENLVCWISGDVLDKNKDKETFITGQILGDFEREKVIAEYAYKKAVKNEIIRELAQ